MATTEAGSSWEVNLEGLNLKDAKDEEQQQQQQELTAVQDEEASPSLGAVEKADVHLSTLDEQPVLYALATPNERMQALRIEEEVLAFIGDTNRDVLEFPQAYGNYQRLLAHKVAQYHGLQTSTADYENSSGRVVAHRKCVEGKSRPRLSELAVSSATRAAAVAWQQQQQQQAGLSRGGSSAGTLPDARPKLLRRPSGSEGQRGNGPDADRQPVVRSAKDREEEYNKARQRIIGEASLGQSSPAAGPAPSSFIASSTNMGVGGGTMAGGRGNGGGGRAMGGGRGMVATPAGAGGGFQGAFRGRGRKPGRADRSTELQQDPDYMRGTTRYGAPSVAYDSTAAANGYMVPGPMYAAMPYPAEAGRDVSGMHTHALGMYHPALQASGMHSHTTATAANRGGPSLTLQPPISSNFSSASSTPTALPPPPPPHGSAALPTPPYPGPAAPGAMGPPTMAAPYPTMTSMAYPHPMMHPQGTPSMYGAMHPAYPYQHPMTPAPQPAYPGATYSAPQDPTAVQGYAPMMHPACAPMMHPQMMHPAAGRSMGPIPPNPLVPYPTTFMPQSPYGPAPTAMPHDANMAYAATNPAAMYQPAAASMQAQQPYMGGGYAQQPSPHSYSGALYSGASGSQYGQSYVGGVASGYSGRGKGRGGYTQRHENLDTCYYTNNSGAQGGGGGRGRGGNAAGRGMSAVQDSGNNGGSPVVQQKVASPVQQDGSPRTGEER